MFFLLKIGGTASTADINNITNNIKDAPVKDKVIVYYFHGDFRCQSCHLIEQYTEQTVSTNFQNELRNNTLVYSVVNVEEKKNKHSVKWQQ